MPIWCWSPGRAGERASKSESRCSEKIIGQMNTDKKKAFCLIRVFQSSPVGILGFFLAGCGSYAEFTLPRLPGGTPPPVYRFVPQPAPVLTRGEFHDALNPSVSAKTNLYSVFD